MRLNILIGGGAGQGVNFLANLIGGVLVRQGLYVFNSRDYQSRVRNGHNFNIVTISDEQIFSNDSKIDILVALNENAKKIHEKDLKKNGAVLKENKQNIYFAGMLVKILGVGFNVLESELKNIGRKVEENLKEAKRGFESAEKKYNFNKKDGGRFFMNGSEAIATGAVEAGLDIYFAYPMTPATSVLNELAKVQDEKNIFVTELENEIAVVNAGIGAAATGAKVMVGSSGGGFDLMTEGLSLTGVAEIPLVFYLAQRQGPGTSSATYTAQADLKMAVNAGHGEFQRVVAAPGDAKEAVELMSQVFYFSQKYKVPSIILSDKHLAESYYTSEGELKITASKKSVEFRRYHDKEVDAENNPTEDAEVTKKNVERRTRKLEEIQGELKNFETYKVYGKKDSENVVIGWGSTTGAIRDAVKDLDCKFVQVLYLEPFAEIKKEIEGKNLILVENNSTGQLGDLIAEKTGILIKKKILKYDGRPFLADELREEIRRELG